MNLDYSAALNALRRLKVQTGSLVCLGCGMEHNCSTKGCAIIRDAIEHMEIGLERYDHWSALLDEYEARLQRCDGAGVDPAEYAAVCKERDDLKAAFEGAKLSMKALNQKLVQITAERDGLAAALCKSIDACDHCKHNGMELPCGDMIPPPECDECALEKAICCKCYAGSGFEFVGVKGEWK